MPEQSPTEDEETELPHKVGPESKASYALVESLVAPNSGCGLKPVGSTKTNRNGSTKSDRRRTVRSGSTAQKRPTPLGVRFRAAEIEIVRAKAKAAGCSTNRYIRASVLGSQYRAPMNPELTRALLGLNRELTAQGNNLNQIARQLNSRQIAPDHGASMLETVGRSLLRTYRDIREVLSHGKEGPDA